MALVVDEEMPRQFAFIAAPSSHPALAVALAVRVVAFITDDSLDIAVATFALSVHFFRVAEVTFCAFITQWAGVAFLAET